MPDLSWVATRPNLRPLAQAATASAGWQRELSWQTAGIEIEGTLAMGLLPFVRPVPLAVSDPLAILGQFTGSIEPAATADADEEAAPTAQSSLTRRRSARPDRLLPVTTFPNPRPLAPAGAPDSPLSRSAGHLSPAGRVGWLPLPSASTKRRPLPAQAPAVANATWLRALAGNLPAAARPHAVPAAVPGDTMAAGRAPAATLQLATRGRRLPLPDPAAGLSLLAELTRTATAGDAPEPGSVWEAEQPDLAAQPWPAGRASLTDTPSPTDQPQQANRLRATVPTVHGRGTAGTFSPGTAPHPPAAMLHRALHTPPPGDELRRPQPELAAILQGALSVVTTTAGRELPQTQAAAGTPPLAPGPPGHETGLALLRQTLPGPHSRPAVPQAAPEAAALPQLPAPPLPAVQNTFNVQVHMEGSPADEEALAARLNRILVEQARRYGIDV